MRNLFRCRRTFTAIVGIISLTILGLWVKLEVSGAIATIVLSIAGANSVQKIMEKK